MEMTNKKNCVWNELTNQYSLSKTLRFELKPIGKGGNQLTPEDSVEFLSDILERDKKIDDAYIALKPVMDKIHEEVITKSLESDKAKEIDFSKYFNLYKNKKDNEKGLRTEENNLRKSISNTYDEGVNVIKEKVGVNEKGDPILSKQGVKCLREAGILKYIENHIDDFVDQDLSKEDLKKHLDCFKRFFTYFSGYNDNRENYYSDEEKSTAVANRIVHDNLPKFSDNVILFQGNRKAEYLEIYDYLNKLGKTLQIKDAEKNKTILLCDIELDKFDIANFNSFLSQKEIEEYNKKIGYYNQMINLYNQERGKDFKKLSSFKTLYKQIGCGKSNFFIKSLKYDTKKEQEEKENGTEILNLQGLLEEISIKGKEYFDISKKSLEEINIGNFISWLKSIENWEGIYWSKVAVGKISNNYLANWHEIQDIIQEGLKDKDKKNSYSTIASFDIKREEHFKLNDAVELSVLFDILDSNFNDEGWSKNLFKDSILEEKSKLVREKPSSSLINFLCDDMEKLSEEFVSNSEEISRIEDYKNEEKKLQIKDWLDSLKSILWIIKYFEVKESKVKGNQVNPELRNFLDDFLHSEENKWFDWYDLVRNYLTKKPQDDVKENLLKLNFDHSTLLNGFVDSYTSSDNATQYGAYLFRKIVKTELVDEYEYFLGISKNPKLFRCHLKDTIQENDKSEYERLEYYQAKSTTYFDSRYSNNKEEILNHIRNMLLSFKNSERTSQFNVDDVYKELQNSKTTPFKIFKLLNKNPNIKHFLNDDYLLELINKLISDLKENSKKFENTAPKLRGIQKNQYIGVSGYEKIVADLQKIATENKEFNYFNVSENEFQEAISNSAKSLYLFKIHNKDLSFSNTSQKDENGFRKREYKGTENLHTLFFRSLMRENGDSTIDIGKGQIFYRQKAINKENIVVHKKGEKIVNRREKIKYDSEDKPIIKFIPQSVHNELYLYVNNRIKKEKLSKEALDYFKGEEIDDTRVIVKEVKHDIVKDKRFTEPKFQFHLSVILNFVPENGNINEKINEIFTNYDNIQFLGIDRGEKHLIYVSLTDSKGNIIEQKHFDIIGGKDYLQEINNAAKLRRERQENWQQKGTIKNLKDGYISLVVHEIVNMMKDSNGDFKPTYIVLEDLNPGFKRGRQKFEQQVYQKFELALAKKLNYLVDKNKFGEEIGSVNKALQLTPAAMNYQDIENRKQFGNMLYTRANYTSVTDPVTGWRKTIYLKKGSQEKLKEQILYHFENIGKDKKGDYFFKYPDKNIGKNWYLWSSKDGVSLTRYRFKRGNNKNEPIIESYDIKEMLDKLFETFDMDKSLLEQIREGKELSKILKEHSPWESLRFVIDLIQQIRNSGDLSKDQYDNFLLSPVRDENGEHFDSTKERSNFPKDADGNGAYNIAKKGIIMYEHIKKWKEEGEPKNDLDLFISDKEWDLWNLDKEEWRKNLDNFTFRSLKLKEVKNAK